MKELKIYLPEGLNEKFRRIAMSVYGYGRGSLSKAAEDALTRWCSEHERSHVPEKAGEHSETTRSPLSNEAESHINPEERESVIPGVKSLGEDRSLNSTGSST